MDRSLTRLLVCIGVVVCCSIQTANADNAQQTAAITVSLLGCPVLAGDEITVGVSDITSLRILKQETRRARAGETWPTGSFEGPPGGYYISVSVGNCRAGEEVALIRGVRRDVSLFGKKGEVITESSGCVGGVLPRGGFRVALRYESTEKTDIEELVPGTVQQNNYFFDGIHAGHAFLRIYGPLYRWVEFDLGTIASRRKTRLTIYNVSAPMLQQAMEHTHGP